MRKIKPLQHILEKERTKRKFTHSRSLMDYKRLTSLRRISHITDASSVRRWDTLPQIVPTPKVKSEKESIKDIMLMPQKMMNMIMRKPKKKT